MTDDEFDLMDELYFVTGFSELIANVSQSDTTVKQLLFRLFQRGWIKILSDADTELENPSEGSTKLEDCFFLATKKGLLAHNS